jgi:hypothetical protein
MNPAIQAANSQIRGLVFWTIGMTGNPGLLRVVSLHDSSKENPYRRSPCATG